MDAAFYPSLSIKSPKPIFGWARHAQIGFSGFIDVTGATAATLSGEVVSGEVVSGKLAPTCLRDYGCGFNQWIKLLFLK